LCDAFFPSLSSHIAVRTHTALQRNVTAINGGSLQAQFHCARGKDLCPTDNRRRYMGRLIQFPTDMKCNRNMCTTLESTLAEYIGAQQRGSCNWRTAGAALNFTASILHIVILKISIYTIPTFSLITKSCLEKEIKDSHVNQNRKVKLQIHTQYNVNTLRSLLLKQRSKF